MASNIKAQVSGGSIQNLDDVETVGDVKKRLEVTGYTATVNGEPADNSYELSDYEFVMLAPAVKGGC